MQLPWRGRTQRPAGDPASPAPRPDGRVWDQVAPLRASVSERVPLTARAAEHSSDIGTRLRSTSVLVHRPRVLPSAGVPDVAGRMEGIATVSSPIVSVARAAADRLGDPAVAPPAQLPVLAQRTAPVRPQLEPPPVLVRLDPETASALVPARRVARTGAPRTVASEPLTFAAPDADEIEPQAALGRPQVATPAPRAAPVPAAVPGHTVVRRRLQPGAPRPVGLQPPLEQASVPARVEASPAAMPASAAVERVPERVASAMQHLHHADVREVPVIRGEAASRLAASMHARALTRGGEVFVPEQRGSLELAENRGLLAHELTHVLQQRRLGTDVPMEHTPAGRALEAQAAATEQLVRGGPGTAPAPADTSHPVAPPPPAGAGLDAVRAVQDELTASGFATRAADGSLVFAAAATAALQTGAPIQRAPDVPGAEPHPADAPSERDVAGQPAPVATPASAPSPQTPDAFVFPEPAPAPAAEGQAQDFGAVRRRHRGVDRRRARGRAGATGGNRSRSRPRGDGSQAVRPRRRAPAHRTESRPRASGTAHRFAMRLHHGR